MSEDIQKYQRHYRANTKRLRSLRTRAHWSLKELATRADVNYTTINRIEQGHNRSPHWSTLEALSEAFGVDVDEIVIYLDDDPTENVPNTEQEETNQSEFKNHIDDRHSEGEDSGERGD